MGWQTIETAPRDGRLVLLYYRDDVVVGQQCEGRWFEGYRGEVLYAGSPTHWQPLPEPPDA